MRLEFGASDSRALDRVVSTKVPSTGSQSGQAGQVLYRKWRHQTFAEIVGQEPVTRTLRNSVASKRIAHAYLLSGPRGTGKTSLGRLVAKARSGGHLHLEVPIEDGGQPNVRYGHLYSFEANELGDMGVSQGLLVESRIDTGNGAERYLFRR